MVPASVMICNCMMCARIGACYFNRLVELYRSQAGELGSLWEPGDKKAPCCVLLRCQFAVPRTFYGNNYMLHWSCRIAPVMKTFMKLIFSLSILLLLFSSNSFSQGPCSGPLLKIIKKSKETLARELELELHIDEAILSNNAVVFKALIEQVGDFKRKNLKSSNKTIVSFFLENPRLILTLEQMELTNSPLTIALEEGLESIKKIFFSGVGVNKILKGDQTALDLSGLLPEVRAFLLKQGAKTFEKTGQSGVNIFPSIKEGDVGRFLRGLSSGAWVNKVNFEEKTPLDVARKKKEELLENESSLFRREESLKLSRIREIIEVLEKRGGVSAKVLFKARLDDPI